MKQNQVGQRERATQNRVLALFKRLHYEYLGEWSRREGNSCIEPQLLKVWLQKRGVPDAHIRLVLLELERAAFAPGRSLYDRNRAVYGLLRYGVSIKPDIGENTVRVRLIDWNNPEENHFGVAEEVTVKPTIPGSHEKRPDVVVYVNGIALSVLELKRSTVSVEEGIRQNLDNQKRVFIEDFFGPIQFVMAGNDTQGLRYGAIETREKYYLSWKEDTFEEEENPLDRALLQLMDKGRFLELIHDFVVFDAGTKKLPRAHQYFGVKAAQTFALRREGGVIWHTQGSGKSLSMVWLARWLREHIPGARVLLITDRTELDEQIERIFLGVEEKIYRTTSGTDLIATLGHANPSLICSLVHKFGRGGSDTGISEDEEDNTEAHVAARDYLAEIAEAGRAGFAPIGQVFVFVDECHRTQSGDLNKAMKALLPGAVFVGFTGTPLLKTDKGSSLETFGRTIHSYKFDEAVRDGVVLDLRYEARDVEQFLGQADRIDDWFESKTRGLTDLARAQLKARWGTLRRLLSSKERLERIVADIVTDMDKRPRLQDGHGNALLVAGSIYQACKYYELFQTTELVGKCAIVTSYQPHHSQLKGQGNALTEQLSQYNTYRKMLASWFHQDEDAASGRVAEFEKEAKEKFVKEPGQLKLLIVVDKLLTGFDAPSATYLYIDKKMRDHGLFQAICRVNRLDGEDKDYGYIVDYRDLFQSIKDAYDDYTEDAFSGFDPEDVAGLLGNRIAKGRERFEELLDTMRALCEPVQMPRDTPAFRRFFVSQKQNDRDEIEANQTKRLTLYKTVAALVRAYAGIAGDMEEAGFDEKMTKALNEEVGFWVKVRDEVKMASGDAIDLRAYEPDMRHLIDQYVRAHDSQKLTSFDDLSLVQLLAERGADAVEALPDDIKASEGAVAETITNNVRRLIIDESPVNPRYYEKMSQLLDALIQKRHEEVISYRQYLEEVARLARELLESEPSKSYPASLETPGQRALYDNLSDDEALALRVDGAVHGALQDGWRGHPIKTRRVSTAILGALDGDAERAATILEQVKHPKSGY